MTTKDTAKQPTPLAVLEELINTRDNNGDEDVQQTTLWLEWMYNFLSARKQYHKKHTVKNALLRKMAETLLSESELAAIDEQAEKELE